VHFLVPGEPFLPFLALLVGEELDREGGFAMLGRQIGFEPLAKLTAEILVFVAESEVHWLAISTPGFFVRAAIFRPPASSVTRNSA
jgi:hypothetical protein